MLNCKNFDGHRRPLQVRAADTPAATALVFLVAEEAAMADDLGNLRRDHLVPGFVAVSDAF
jgi:hypothetical protein